MVSGIAPLLEALDELERLLEYRLRCLFEQPDGTTPVAPPSSRSSDNPGDDAYRRFVETHSLDPDAQILLTLALAPWIKPELFDAVLHVVFPQGGEFPELGGVRGVQHRGFLPTGQTALFLLAGNDPAQRLRWTALLRGGHPLIARGVVRLEDPPSGEPPMSGQLQIDPDTAERLLIGVAHAPRLSSRFPATRLETGMEWDDLVLAPVTMRQIEELLVALRHESVLMDDWGMRRKLRPGYRVLFYGPPGTGKTLTVTLIGKATGRDVYRVDLSLVVSKYIGETEKNLSNLFDRAENKDWILFFDEADALFGKRTQLKDSHDRYANQGVSYLLQRIECFDGLVVLASNLSGNVDEAFARRFEQTLHFPMPRASERVSLWHKALPSKARFASDIVVEDLASQHELTGAMIMNVMRYACVSAIERGESLVRRSDLTVGIRRELAKDNRLK
jgi:hypothetical protein